MTWSSGISLVAGLAALGILIATNDPGEIFRLVLEAGWGLAAVIALHMPQVLFSALGWAPLIEDPRRPGWVVLFRLRWIREAVNALLPVAQVAGEFARVQLLILRGVKGMTATASVVVDLATEMVAQILFAVLGLAVLLLIPHQGQAAIWIAAATAFGGAMAIAFMAALRWGLFRLVEHALARLAGRFGLLGALGGVSGLHDAVVRLYRDPRRLWLSGGAHLASWLLGTLETWLAMRLLGIEGGLAEALVIESLSQTVRSMGFMVPGALGVQEGGFVLICAMFGIPPDQAIALALIRRIRDIVLGLPGLIAWRWEVTADSGSSQPASAASGRSLP